MNILFIAASALALSIPSGKVVVVDESNVQCSATPRIADGQTIQTRVKIDRILADWRRQGFKPHVVRIPDGYSYNGPDTDDLKIVRPSC
ncbi:MAG: hypothetical protein ACTHJR_10990 [Sphingomonas sp.]|uniref:hypothetical protein n=1 Tax=Sphingomonas sp. TaxID=28214 RepID=UPI003F7E1EA5